MTETELQRVQHQTWRLERRVRIVLRVHALTNEGMPCLRQMNADLMRATGLQATLDERRAAQRFAKEHGSHGLTTERWVVGRAAPTVTAILHQARGNRAIAHATVHDRSIAPTHR